MEELKNFKPKVNNRSTSNLIQSSLFSYFKQQQIEEESQKSSSFCLSSSRDQNSQQSKVINAQLSTELLTQGQIEWRDITVEVCSHQSLKDYQNQFIENSEERQINQLVFDPRSHIRTLLNQSQINSSLSRDQLLNDLQLCAQYLKGQSLNINDETIENDQVSILISKSVDSLFHNQINVEDELTKRFLRLALENNNNESIDEQKIVQTIIPQKNLTLEQRIQDLFFDQNVTIKNICKRYQMKTHKVKAILQRCSKHENSQVSPKRERFQIIPKNIYSYIFSSLVDCKKIIPIRKIKKDLLQVFNTKVSISSLN